MDSWDAWRKEQVENELAGLERKWIEDAERYDRETYWRRKIEQFRVTSIIVVFSASILAAVAIPLVQGAGWLKSGVWPNYSVAQLYAAVGLPVVVPANTSWLGANFIIDGFYSAHGSIGAVAAGIAAVAAIRFVFFCIDDFY